MDRRGNISEKVYPEDLAATDEVCAFDIEETMWNITNAAVGPSAAVNGINLKKRKETERQFETLYCRLSTYRLRSVGR